MNAIQQAMNNVSKDHPIEILAVPKKGRLPLTEQQKVERVNKAAETRKRHKVEKAEKEKQEKEKQEKEKQEKEKQEASKPKSVLTELSKIDMIIDMLKKKDEKVAAPEIKKTEEIIKKVEQGTKTIEEIQDKVEKPVPIPPPLEEDKPASGLLEKHIEPIQVEVQKPHDPDPVRFNHKKRITSVNPQNYDSSIKMSSVKADKRRTKKYNPFLII